MPTPAAIKPFPLLVTLWQRIEAAPKPPPEDSLLLRVLVQAMVTVGIVAVDVAAADVSDSLRISLWAVPVSIVGAVWSGYRRHKRNIPVQFCIAIAMLFALGLFFMRLLAERNDTRLALAELLIQLQVFHSFDLPRRRDLGYSTVIGLILIGVAATLSQTLWFAPLLIMFIALALPVLVLDYRSRLGLVPQGLRKIGAELSPRRLGGVLAVILALGLLIFAFLPRFPGYQLRAFPVSPPIEFEGQFNSGDIINPGYVNEGKQTEDQQGTGGADDALAGKPGQVNPDQYYGFNLQMNQNLRGAMKPKVVMRVRSQAEGFWRVMAFDRYTGKGWQVTRNGESDVPKLERPLWSMRFNLPWSVTLGRRREVVQSYTVVANLPNLIPALYEPKELYFPTRQVALDRDGALRSPVPLSEGLTYTVVSEVPYRDRTTLRRASINYPQSVRGAYLQVPEAIRERVQQKTEELLATSPNVLTDVYEKALYLAQRLKQEYRIQPDLPFLERNEDLVEAFLFKYEGGYPDHFSTVLTVMLRSIGIPARLVAGYQPGDFNPFTGYYVVRNTHALVMTEVYFHKYGWFAFNPIPGMDLIPPSVEDSQVFSVLQQFWKWVAGWLPSPLTGFLSGLFETITGGLGSAIALITSLFNRGWLGLLIGSALVTLASFLGWLLWSGWRAWRYRRWLARLHPMEALYQRMLRWLAEQGLQKAPAQTPLEFAAQGRQQSFWSAVMDDISRAYVQWRYGGEVPNVVLLRRQLKQAQKFRPVKRQPLKKH